MYTQTAERGNPWQTHCNFLFIHDKEYWTIDYNKMSMFA